ncbi:MAG: hotdog domain-containing protein [Pyrodictiaceae archaeon]
MLASRYVRGIVVTARVDSTAFYAPIRIGDIYNIFAAIIYVSRSTIKVTL